MVVNFIHLWYLVASAWAQPQETTELVPPSAKLVDVDAVDEQAEQLKHHVCVHGQTYSLRTSSRLTCAPLCSSVHEKLDGLPGVAVIRDDILVMGHGDNEEEAN